MQYRCAIVAGVLAITGGLLLSMMPASAQQTGTDGPAPSGDRWCRCVAEKAHCLFGTAGGCHIECPPGSLCQCEGATCPLGFPSSASCTCTGVMS